VGAFDVTCNEEARPARMCVHATGGASGVGYVDKSLHIRSPA